MLFVGVCSIMRSSVPTRMDPKLFTRSVPSLLARTALYFNFCVTARFRLSPVPTNVKEVNFIKDSFAKLATLEYFHIERQRHDAYATFGQHVTVVLNPSGQLSQLDPLNGIDTTIRPTYNILRHAQTRLVKVLLTTCAVPRFSYVEHDSDYFEGNVQVPFKHTLVANGANAVKNYNCSTSTGDSPFIRLKKPGDDPKSIIPKMRHNFQKFHKMLPVAVEPGMAGIRKLLGSEIGATVKVPTNSVVDAETIMDLEREMEMEVTRTPSSRFSGFTD